MFGPRALRRSFEAESAPSPSPAAQDGNPGLQTACQRWLQREIQFILFLAFTRPDSASTELSISNPAFSSCPSITFTFP
jgi:hypothetical protein